MLLLVVRKELKRLRHICLFFMLLLLSQDLPSQSLVLRAGVVVRQEPQGLRHGYYCLLHHPHLHILEHTCTYLNILAHTWTYLHILAYIILAHAYTCLHILAHTCTYLHILSPTLTMPSLCTMWYPAIYCTAQTICCIDQVIYWYSFTLYLCSMDTTNVFHMPNKCNFFPWDWTQQM